MRREVNRDSGSFAKYSDIGLVTISFPACCVSHRATGLPVMVHDMHTRRTRPDYLQACPTGPPVDGVKSALTPALWTCGPVPFAVTLPVHQPTSTSTIIRWPYGTHSTPGRKLQQGLCLSILQMTLSVTIYFPPHCGHTGSPDWDVPQGRLWVESRPRRLRPCAVLWPCTFCSDRIPAFC